MSDALPVRNLTREDLLAVLFINFPTDWPWEKSRAELERMIRRNGDTEITPATILTAFVIETIKLLDNLPDQELVRRATAFWLDRAKRLRAAGVKPQTSDEDWNF